MNYLKGMSKMLKKLQDNIKTQDQLKRINKDKVAY